MAFIENSQDVLEASSLSTCIVLIRRYSCVNTLPLRIKITASLCLINRFVCLRIMDI